jgi:CubicO group peptidase (beta-lactamase class C family)
MRWFRKLIPWIVIAATIAAMIYLPDVDPERYTDYSSLFGTERRRQANAGFSVAVCKNGKIVYQGSFGKDGAGNPIARDSPMYLGPSSEILSGALLYSLSLKGSLSLDDDIRKHLPSLDISIPRSLRDIESLKENDTALEENLITILQIASHAVDLSGRDLEAFRSRISGMEAGQLDPEFFLLSRFSAESAPRSRLAYRLLGTIMENAEGQSFHKLLESSLLIPLGMHGTTADPDSLQGIVVGSGLFFGLAFPYDSRVPIIAAPADGIVSTAEDVARFLSYITAPPSKGIASIPPAKVTNLYQPLMPDSSSGFGWRVESTGGDRRVYQGGSVEGFSSRVVIWPERNAGIAILSAQGGVIQSNIVLPLLTQAAESLLFTGSSPRLFALNRVLIILGISLLVYLISLLMQTTIARSWARNVLEKRELGRLRVFHLFTLGRTILGVGLRIALLFAAPYLVGQFLGTPHLGYHDLFTMEPGSCAALIILLSIGTMRNCSRLVWLYRINRG